MRHLICMSSAMKPLFTCVESYADCIWDSKNPPPNVEYGPFFTECTIGGMMYVDNMLKLWLWAQQREDFSGHSLFQQDGASPHYHLDMREFLPGSWIGCGGTDTLVTKIPARITI